MWSRGGGGVEEAIEVAGYTIDEVVTLKGKCGGRVAVVVLVFGVDGVWGERVVEGPEFLGWERGVGFEEMGNVRGFLK